MAAAQARLFGAAEARTDELVVRIHALKGRGQPLVPDFKPRLGLRHQAAFPEKAKSGVRLTPEHKVGCDGKRFDVETSSERKAGR